MHSSVTLRTRQSDRRGFTIAELLVASMVITTALLGVYTLFKQAMAVESRAAVRWNEQAAAEALVRHIVEILEQCVNIPDTPAIVAGPDEDGGTYSLTCVVVGSGFSGGRPEQVGLQRRRYRWNFDSDSGRTGTMELQTMYYAGTRNITAGAGHDELSEEEMWNRTPVEVIAKRVQHLSLRFRSLDDPQAPWQDRWNAPAGSVAVGVQAAVGGQSADAIVVPQVRGLVIEQEGP